VCKTTSPAITNLAQENADGSADKAYNIISVALSSGSDEEINAYLTQQEYQFDAINDDNGQISKAWGVAVTPSLFIIDSSGDISFKSTGITSLWGMKVRLWLASL
jgi:peroxiredoxin